MKKFKKITAIIGTVCLAFAMEPTIVWIIISNQKLTLVEAEEKFLNCFPQFL